MDQPTESNDQQQQLRRENIEEEEDKKEMTIMRQLPLESSPYLRHTDLEDYKVMGYSAEGLLSPKGGGITTATARDGSRISPRQADGDDRNLKGIENQIKSKVKMVLGVLKGKPLVTKAAAVAKYGVLPAAMIAALVYSPPDYTLPKQPPTSASSH
ncbi:hypothetical protein BUALT_Bualt08G0005800 [Buddleja alternifolia]|uniref:Uncharacterized protein n=1 Tax=Buddleja alternifolia TaxID=168488 RepID=A0AAV6X9Y9_9LAMI|nr:hypothetical protein BUALT_Bualt08G0005800 [Buddleja alternifolia]